MCNLSYAWQRADLVAALGMADGKQRRRALDEFEDYYSAPLGGWDDLDRRLNEAIRRA